MQTVDTQDVGAEPPDLEPAWTQLRDEDLLKLRICDLAVTIEGSEVAPRVEQLYGELAERSVPLRPPCYLSDEWFTPTGMVHIAVPFYLANARLKALELKQMLVVEGGEASECMQLLRHECGHAIDHAYRFSRRRKWQALFGRSDDEATPDTYRPRPYSRGFVVHLSNWYAQAHPDEDFAETFAVWLSMPQDEWQRRYRNWKALEKLKYVHELMREIPERLPRIEKRRPIADASRMRKTLGAYYALRRRQYAEEYPDFYDDDLREIFARSDPGEESAAKLMRRHRKGIVTSLCGFTDQHKYTVDQLVRKLTLRCEILGLMAPRDEARLMLDLGVYLSSLVTNHLHTGKFKRSV